MCWGPSGTRSGRLLRGPVGNAANVETNEKESLQGTSHCVLCNEACSGTEYAHGQEVIEELGSKVGLVVMPEELCDQVVTEERRSTISHVGRGHGLHQSPGSAGPGTLTDRREELLRCEAINWSEEEVELSDRESCQGTEHYLSEPSSRVMMALLEERVDVLHVEPGL